MIPGNHNHSQGGQNAAYYARRIPDYGRIFAYRDDESRIAGRTGT